MKNPQATMNFRIRTLEMFALEFPTQKNEG